MPEHGINLRVVFSESPEEGQTGTRLLTDMFSFRKRPDARNPRRLASGALLAGATAVAIRPLITLAGYLHGRNLRGQ